MLRSLRFLPSALVAASLALAPTAAHAASKKSVYPTVSSISPRKLAVGQRLTIHGAHFRSGAGKTTVVFLRPSAPSIFLKADSATSRRLVVTIPQKFQSFLSESNGAPVATMFHLRILASKFSKASTKNSRSPLIFPLGTALTGPGTGKAAPPGAQAPGAVSLSCQQEAAANAGADADKDGLSNGTELQYQLDPCNADTDGDGATDSYEYFSGLDLNGAAHPYPGTRPWPNPLDPSDGRDDFDGDGLTLAQEYTLWRALNPAGHEQYPLAAYSDGNQNTGGSQPVVTQAQSYLDLDGDGNLTDDERDYDGDGLSNIVEFSYTGTQEWWRGIAWPFQPHGSSRAYVEPWYIIRHFSNVDATRPDSDGDGISDSQDDQDNDGWSNFVEMQLGRGRTGYRVHPFNPCLPDPHAATCSRWIPMGATAWPPFDPTDSGTSQMVGDAVPFSWPNVVYADWDGRTPAGVLTGAWNPGAGFFTGPWDGFGGPQGP